jgi:hypothetical protein
MIFFTTRGILFTGKLGISNGFAILMQQHKVKGRVITFDIYYFKLWLSTHIFVHQKDSQQQQIEEYVHHF